MNKAQSLLSKFTTFSNFTLCTEFKFFAELNFINSEFFVPPKFCYLSHDIQRSYTAVLETQPQQNLKGTCGDKKVGFKTINIYVSLSKGWVVLVDSEVFFNSKLHNLNQ